MIKISGYYSYKKSVGVVGVQHSSNLNVLMCILPHCVDNNVTKEKYFLFVGLRFKTNIHVNDVYSL